MNVDNKSTITQERYTFVVKWQDGESSLNKNFILHCYFDNSVELIDTKNGKLFLRRVMCEGVKAENINVGDIVDIYSRRMEVVKYGDARTQSALEELMQKTVGLMKGVTMDKLAHTLDTIISTSCKITKLETVEMGKDNAMNYFNDKENSSNNANVSDELIGPIVALEISGRRAIVKWQEIIDAEASGSSTGRRVNEIKAAFYGSNSADQYEKDKNLFFVPKNGNSTVSVKPTTTFKDCSLAIIKPHAVLEGIYPKIIRKIHAMNFKISAIKMHHLSRPEAEELFEIYRGILPEYKEMLDRFVIGPSIGLEITGFGKDTTNMFRTVVGPRDPEIARMLRPSTIRAEFGKTAILNAIYCTDLEGDGIPECKLFFKT